MSREKIIVPLDVGTVKEALELVAELGDYVGGFKIGLQLFTAAGPSLVRDLVRLEQKIFLDVKFHDIPNTVARAGVEVARLGVWMFNVHAVGGGEMMRRTVEEVGEVCARESLKRPKIIGVTVLTSSDQTTLGETGIEREVNSQVLNLAQLTAKCGLDGVVASGLDLELIRTGVEKENFLIVTPGIRPDFATKDDQRRVITPGEAIRRGSDYLVIGRPITGASDRIKAARMIIEEMEGRPPEF